ncbi:hypothetical protein ACMYMK_23185, partial [Salmonella enterica subsp. enterica serovar Enteritidis]|uniref:hypothetical protein n=1 Tax=Salmonella enterica TaxID=28901 RepID=UPI0039E82DBA
MGTLCIYHHNCADGFTAAWVVRKAHREGLIKGPLSFHGGVHQDPPPPEVSGKHVLLVDFSYKGEDLEWVLSEAA